MKEWLIVCAILMGFGALLGVAGTASGMTSNSGENTGFGAMIFGMICFVIGFFGGVVVILAYSL